MSEPGKFVLLRNVQASSKNIKKAKHKKDKQLKQKQKLHVQLKKTAIPIQKQSAKIPQAGDGTSKKKKKNNQKQKHPAPGRSFPHEVASNNARNKKQKPQKQQKQQKPQKPQIDESFEEPKNFQDDLAGRLKASRFRFINEQLYTQSGDEAIKVFNEDDSAFSTYHEGYRIQVKQWPINPLDRIIKSIKKL